MRENNMREGMDAALNALLDGPAVHYRVAAPRRCLARFLDFRVNKGQPQRTLLRQLGRSCALLCLCEHRSSYWWARDCVVRCRSPSAVGKCIHSHRGQDRVHLSDPGAALEVGVSAPSRTPDVSFPSDSNPSNRWPHGGSIIRSQ